MAESKASEQKDGRSIKIIPLSKIRLTCHGKPVRGVKVKLYDDDRGLDTDDHLGTGKSDGEGRFEVSGSEDEITSRVLCTVSMMQFDFRY